MKLTTLLLLTPALFASALPIPSTDIFTEISAREASFMPEAEPLYYIKRTGYTLPKRKANAEAEPVSYIKRTGYGIPEKWEAQCSQ